MAGDPSLCPPPSAPASPSAELASAILCTPGPTPTCGPTVFLFPQKLPCLHSRTWPLQPGLLAVLPFHHMATPAGSPAPTAHSLSEAGSWVVGRATLINFGVYPRFTAGQRGRPLPAPHLAVLVLPLFPAFHIIVSRRPSSCWRLELPSWIAHGPLFDLTCNRGSKSPHESPCVLFHSSIASPSAHTALNSLVSPVADRSAPLFPSLLAYASCRRTAVSCPSRIDDSADPSQQRTSQSHCNSRVFWFQTSGRQAGRETTEAGKQRSLAAWRPWLAGRALQHAHGFCAGWRAAEPISTGAHTGLGGPWDKKLMGSRHAARLESWVLVQRVAGSRAAPPHLFSELSPTISLAACTQE